MKRTTTNALTILDRRHKPSLIDRHRRRRYRQELEIAEMIHHERERIGISQRELAKRVGTTASVICRLEDAEYEGHSLSMLRRVAAAFGRRVEVRFVPDQSAVAPG